MPVHRQEAPPHRTSSPRPHPSKPEAHPPPSSSPAGAAPLLGSHAPPFHPSRAAPHPRMTPLALPPLQERFLADAMDEVRDRAAKRRRMVEGAHGGGGAGRAPAARPREEADGAGGDGDEADGGSGVESTSGFDILEELDARPDVVRVVATSGGLITHWNASFAAVVRPVRKAPLSIFDLVASTSLPALYDIFALALHGAGVGGVEDVRCCGGEGEEGGSGSPARWSITLPCRAFRESEDGYHITVVFMNDDVAARRCFLGILAPRRTDARARPNEPISGKRPGGHSGMPLGKIVRASDDVLCRMLLGSGSPLPVSVE